MEPAKHLDTVRACVSMVEIMKAIDSGIDDVLLNYLGQCAAKSKACLTSEESAIAATFESDVVEFVKKIGY